VSVPLSFVDGFGFGSTGLLLLGWSLRGAA